MGVATSGKPLPPAVGLLAALAISTVVLSACTAARVPTSQDKEAAHSGPPSPSATSPTDESRTENVRRCRVQPPHSLALATKGQWKQDRHAQIAPFTSSATGPWVAAQVRTDSFFGVALVNLSTNKIRPLDRFSRSRDQALGAYDGSVAVWKEFHQLTSLDNFTVKEWSSHTGRVETVGHSRKNPKSGEAYPSPWMEPVLRDGYAAWVEGTDPQGAGDLMVLDTKTATTTVARSGHPGAVLIYHHHLIWTESPRPGALTKVKAMSLTTGQQVAPPDALSQQRGGTFFATDGRALAWVGSDLRSLYYAPVGSAHGKLIVHLKIGGFNPPTVVRGTTVMSTYSAGVLVADATGSWATIVHGGGSVTGSGGSFLVGAPAHSKSSTAHRGLARISVADIHLPDCADGS